MEQSNDTAQPRKPLKPRAERFPIQTALRIRESGSTEWIEGTTVNISSTGILFSAPTTLPLDTMLEMAIIFPAEITGGTSANVICSGPIVRTAPADSPNSPGAQAAAILSYHFTHE